MTWLLWVFGVKGDSSSILLLVDKATVVIQEVIVENWAMVYVVVKWDTINKVLSEVATISESGVSSTTVA